MVRVWDTLISVCFEEGWYCEMCDKIVPAGETHYVSSCLLDRIKKLERQINER
jgi:hypothetical protein